MPLQLEQCNSFRFQAPFRIRSVGGWLRCFLNFSGNALSVEAKFSTLKRQKKAMINLSICFDEVVPVYITVKQVVANKAVICMLVGGAKLVFSKRHRGQVSLLLYQLTR